MASSAIFLTVFLIASTSGFTIQYPQAATNSKSSETFGLSPRPLTSAPQFRTQANPRSEPVAGYPKVPPPNAHEAGGNEEDLLPPFEDSPAGFSSFRSQSFRRSTEDVKVDPKTGYPLTAQPFWRFAGGNEETLGLPLQDSLKTDAKSVDPKTGYALRALPEWKSAGGDGDILEPPFEGAVKNFEKKEAVDPKTGYPLVADPSWKDAGGNEEILDLPVEDPADRVDGDVDPKTGYPLIAQPGWNDAGGDETILELPLEEPNKPEEAVDPRTGYPLIAQPSWKDAGGDGDILELPLESDEKTEREAVDPKTGYPLVAEPGWKDAGGDGEILEPPLEENKSDKVPVDPKTGYPLRAEPSWKDAGGDGDILELPLEEPNDAEKKSVDPKTGYPLTAEPGWKDAGGNGDILQLPFEDAIPTNELQSRSNERQYHVFDVIKLTELVPPPKLKNFPVAFGNSFSTPSPLEPKFFQQGDSHAFLGGNQKRNSLKTPQSTNLREFFSRPVESSYTFAGPDNIFVTVVRFLSANKQRSSDLQTDDPNGFSQNGFNENGSSNDFVERQSFQTFAPRS